MTKLTKQQIILLIAMVIAILFGIYHFIFSKPSPKTPIADGNKRSAELKNFAQDVSLAIVKDKPPEFYRNAAAKAEITWRADPFYDTKSYKLFTLSKEKSKSAGKEKKAITFMYTGYLEANRKKMAIINGIEYGVGESLEFEGYALQNIFPTKVVIIQKGEGTKIEIPLLEEGERKQD
ncbi:MAG: hypothetical protein JW925_12865 [Syntrophaceae bacterium]|nr:hypothetical protein [Syntrophaceae bacterium]